MGGEGDGRLTDGNLLDGALSTYCTHDLGVSEQAIDYRTASPDERTTRPRSQ